MKTIVGKFNEAKLYSENLDYGTCSQIQNLLDQEAYKDYKVAIMPDYHSGKGCVIGFTASGVNRLSPNLLGVDLSCGVLAVNIGKVEIDLKNLDEFIRNNIPHGKGVNKEIDRTFLAMAENEIKKVCKEIGDEKSYDRHLLSIGSLGGGNHYIEINVDSLENKWIVIHSGSRNFGNKIATFYQKKAITYCKEMREKLKKETWPDLDKIKSENRASEIQKFKEKYEKSIYSVPDELAFLEGELLEEYIRATKVADKFARANRLTMARRIMDHLELERAEDSIHTIHNYLDGPYSLTKKETYIRKGAISAKENELVIIPINMRDGSIIAKGLGNKEGNYSAPHGAGRLMSRSEAKMSIDMKSFKETMKNVYSSSVTESTIDEAPFAYKPIEEIMENTKELMEVIEVIRPIYNFKA